MLKVTRFQLPPPKRLSTVIKTFFWKGGGGGMMPPMSNRVKKARHESTTLMYQNEILQETCDYQVLSEDHQLFLITFKTGLSMKHEICAASISYSL